MDIENELIENKKRLVNIKRQKCLINPKIYISESVNKTGTRFYIGRGYWINQDGTHKVLSVYLGKIDDFDPENEQHLEMAKDKMINQFKKQLKQNKIN
jgi:hypothetical protein